MSYRIVYGKDKSRFCQLLKRRKTLILVVICVAFLVTGLLFTDRVVTSGTALDNMVDAVRSGETLSDAVVAFCQEIIENAQLPQ